MLYWFVNIAATDKNGYIGKNNKLPWNLKSEMREFLETIKDYDVVMGRKTCESLPKKLNNHRNFVLTKNPSFHREGFITVTSVEKLLTLVDKSKPTYVVGGSTIYELFLKLASERDDIYLTNELSVIDIEVEGDVKYPVELLKGYNKELISTNSDEGIIWKKYLYHK